MSKKMEIKRVNKDSLKVKNGHPSSIKNLNTIKNVIISKMIVGVDEVVEVAVVNNFKIVTNANRTLVATTPNTNIKTRVTTDKMIIAETTSRITLSQNIITVMVG